MNQLQNFNHPQFGKLEILIINGKELFPATDVAKKLGYSNANDAVNRHCRKDGVVFHEVIDLLGRKQQKKFISEGNLYRLITNSKLPQAEKFESWVFDEVLPSIRKNGIYMTDKIAQEITNNPEIIHFLAEQVAKINASSEEANHKLETIDKKIEGEYVTPQDLYAINYAIKVKSEKFVDDAGTQLTIDSVLAGDIYEQAQASKKAKEQRKYDIGKVKRQILVAVKKYLGMKGNAPNNHIKRKDVDAAVQFIKSVKQSELNAS